MGTRSFTFHPKILAQWSISGNIWSTQEIRWYAALFVHSYFCWLAMQHHHSWYAFAEKQICSNFCHRRNSWCQNSRTSWVRIPIKLSLPSCWECRSYKGSHECYRAGCLWGATTLSSHKSTGDEPLLIGVWRLARQLAVATRCQAVRHRCPFEFYLASALDSLWTWKRVQLQCVL